MTDRSATQGGYSLIEILVVLVIASLAFAVAAVSVSSLRARITPASLAADLARMIMDARLEAQTSGDEQVIVFDRDAKRFSFGSETVAIPANISIKAELAQEASQANGKGGIIFLPDGTCSGATIKLGAPGQTSIRLELNWLTGLAFLTEGGADDRP